MPRDALAASPEPVSIAAMPPSWLVAPTNSRPSITISRSRCAASGSRMLPAGKLNVAPLPVGRQRAGIVPLGVNTTTSRLAVAPAAARARGHVGHHAHERRGDGGEAEAGEEAAPRDGAARWRGRW
jgi:hypothetical protein